MNAAASPPEPANQGSVPTWQPGKPPTERWRLAPDYDLRGSSRAGRSRRSGRTGRAGVYAAPRVRTASQAEKPRKTKQPEPTKVRPTRLRPGIRCLNGARLDRFLWLLTERLASHTRDRERSRLGDAAENFSKLELSHAIHSSYVTFSQISHSRVVHAVCRSVAAWPLFPSVADLSESCRCAIFEGSAKFGDHVSGSCFNPARIVPI
jgi:hypothetical protein